MNDPTHASSSLEHNQTHHRSTTHHVVGIGQILLKRSIDLIGAEAGSDEGIARLVSVRGQLGLDGGNQRRVGDGPREGLFDGGNRVGGSAEGAAR